MKTANEITEELRSMGSILADLPRTMPYTLPADYFAQLHAGMYKLIADINETDNQHKGWSRQMPFRVPEGYFAALPDEMTAKAIASSMPAAGAFSVPEGYFNNLPVQMLQAAKNADTVKENKPRRISLVRSLKWAAAAILVAGIGIGTYKAIQPQATNPEKLLAAVPANELQDYVQNMYRIDVNQMTASNDLNSIQLENKDIIQYLNETGWD